MKNYFKYVYFVMSILISGHNLLATNNENKILQPDYDKWEQVKKGMTIEEVKKLLGEPLILTENTTYKADIKTRKVIKLKSFLAIYGAIASYTYAGNIVQFQIYYENGKVAYKRSPFENRKLSKDGKPTTPKLILPYDKAIFTHYPCVTDFRWFASSGEYPMSYKIQFDAYINFRKKWHSSSGISITTHYASVLGGYGKFRWRIKAINKLGESNWSEYRYFEFRK